MDRIQAMQIFMRVAQAGSFVRAAETLSLPSSTVTSSIKNLENYLQVRLLNRTTRRVSLTAEGVQYLAQCQEILALIDHAETSLTASVRRPQGRLRVDMPGGIADFIVMPHLKDFYRLYPDIYLMLGVNDRQVDLVQEGVDCVIRTISGSTVLPARQTTYHSIGRYTIFPIRPDGRMRYALSAGLRPSPSLSAAKRP